MAGNEQYLANNTIIDHYEVRERLGVGGFGITYKAWDAHLDRWVAIKEFLPAELALRDSGNTTVQARTDRGEEYHFALDKFLQEAKTLAKFTHPNIVGVTRYLEANGTAYLVMQYEEGQSLSQYLKRNGGLVPEQQLRDWFIPILRGLVEVHKVGFLHRDIKPGNIYLRDEGEPLLIDFGAARQAIGEHSRSVTGIVSAGYAPTEQYGTDVKKQGPWTDLYSVGATLYRCAVGKDPVDAPTRQSAQFEGDPDPLVPARDTGAGNYSPAFLQLIDELLVLPIKQRPQTAAPVLEALSSGLSLSPEEPRTTTVTRVVTPGGSEKVAPEPPKPAPTPEQAPKPGTSSPREPDEPPANPAIAGNGAMKAVIIMVIVGLLGTVGYLLLSREEKPTPVATYKPPVTAVKPEPAQNTTAVAPPPVMTEPVVQRPEPEPQPEPEPPATGQLTLTLSPSNANVVLPDIGPRYSPGMKLELGSYRVKVTAAGYARWEGRVEISEGHNRHQITLEPLPRLQAGEVFRNKLKSGGQGPELVVLPTGSFRMGDLSGEGDDDEKPVHSVAINREIAMGRYEVTVGEFRRFVRATGYRTDAEKNAGGNQGCYTREFADKARNKWDWTPGRYWDDLEYTVESSQPVVCVSWNDAQAYVSWLSKESGKGYRLPSESEWEYAARAGSTSKYHFGNDPNQLCRYGNVADTTTLPNGGSWNGSAECSDGAIYPTGVGSYRANAFGLYDMHGNVWEWVQDCWHDNYQGAPLDGSSWERGGDCAKRVLRGGSWSNIPGNLRSANRVRNAPSNRNSINGFRLVQDLDS